ncbi:hypothetical protein QFC21_006870 [Naganishia friedmannii]|uniref:Uncharacterized protein n=1 Tax=Naganishia friedmannii TaxID=89922 RepID=A0ACC2UZV9_9TREE|nr:hypothetical protein QFC21_006870 [Naganishia friedmannii]
MPTDGPVDSSTSCSAYLYSAFPPELFKEVEAYDRRAGQAEPLHYFSDNQHAQYVCKECMVPLALQDEVVSKAFSGSLGRA